MLKRALALTLSLLLFASPAWATIASVGTLTSTPGTSTSSTTTVAATLSATAEAGNLVVCFGAFDNIQTADTADTTDVTLSDSVGGNTWIRWKESQNANGSAAAGVGAFKFYSVLSNQIASSATITATFGSAIVSKTLSCWEFTVGAAVEVPASGTTQIPTDAGDNPSIALSGFSSAERLYVRVEGVESNSGTSHCWAAVTTNYTAMTSAAANQGFVATSVSACAEFRIVTATGETSNPTDTGATTLDRETLFGALQQVGAAAPTQRGGVIFFQ